MNLNYTIPTNYDLLKKLETAGKNESDEKPAISKIEFNKYSGLLNQSYDFAQRVTKTTLISKSLSYKTTLTELIEITAIKESIIGHIKRKLEITPFKKETLQTIIDGYKDQFQRPSNTTFTSNDLRYNLIAPKHWQPEQLAFYAICMGVNATLQSFAHYFFEEIGDHVRLIPAVEQSKWGHFIAVTLIVKDIAVGAAMAYIIPELERQLETIDNHQQQPADNEPATSEPAAMPTDRPKLKWLGTPAQFGFIIQELIGKGYLERPTASYKKDAEIYRSMFEIIGEKSTLEKEISTGDSQNSLSPKNRAQIKIPNIDKLT